MTQKTQQALVALGDGKVGVKADKVIPTISANEILVKVKAVTLNPTDYKHAEGQWKPGDSTGMDFAGDIAEIGKAAEEKGFRVGDPVAGFIRGGYADSNNGAFSEYVKVRPELIWHKPTSLPYEDASSMGGIALSTAAFALYHRLGLPKPWESASTPPKPVLVWAGSTSVGLFAVALAKLSGVPVVSTASPKNHDLVKSRGADAVFDYKDPDVNNKIQAWAKDKGYSEGIPYALDCISEHGSTELIAKSLSSQGGKVIVLLKPEGRFPSHVSVELMLVYSVLDEANEEDFAFIQEWYSHLPSLIQERGFGNAIPLKVSRDGLAGIPEGLEVLRNGQVSGQKLAYIISA